MLGSENDDVVLLSINRYCCVPTVLRLVLRFVPRSHFYMKKIPNFGIDNSARVGNIMGGLFRNCQRGLNHFQKETSSLIEISENQIMKLRCKNYHSDNCTFVGTFSCIFSIMALILNALLNSGA